MAHYDRIAKKWHAVTGFRGGPFKRYVLNDRILDQIDAIEGRALLELGAGNGYFMPLMMRRFSGQIPARIVITDASPALIEITQRHFPIPGAEYRLLDIRNRFPFDDGCFDLILATMVFNELPTAGLRRGLSECRRVLDERGQLLITVTHPDFVRSLQKRRQLKEGAKGIATMPAARGLRVPVCRRSVRQYADLLTSHRFRFACEDVFPDHRVLNEKPALKKAGKVPLALLFRCTRTT